MAYVLLELGVPASGYRGERWSIPGGEVGWIRWKVTTAEDEWVSEAKASLPGDAVRGSWNNGRLVISRGERAHSNGRA